MKKVKLLNIILPIVTVVFIFATWAIVSAIVNKEYLFPSLGAIFVALFDTIKAGSFYVAYFSTLLRSGIAFLISFIIALGFAVIGKKYPLFEKVISPVIKIIRALPTIAIVLLLLFWTNSQIAPVVVTMLVVLPTTYNGIKESLNAVDQKQIEACVLFNVKSKDIFLKVQLPQIAPSMLQLIGQGISLNLKLMVAAEVLAATYISLGNVLNSAKYNAEIASMLAVVLICVLTGVIIELAFNLISKKVGKWQ